jgi:hypothetical protein
MMLITMTMAMTTMTAMPTMAALAAGDEDDNLLTPPCNKNTDIQPKNKMTTSNPGLVLHVVVGEEGSVDNG